MRAGKKRGRPLEEIDAVISDGVRACDRALLRLSDEVDSVLEADTVDRIALRCLMDELRETVKVLCSVRKSADEARAQSPEQIKRDTQRYADLFRRARQQGETKSQ